MKHGRRMAALFATAAAVLLMILGAAGCGSGNGGGGESYEDVLRGLKTAALSNTSYHALRRARGLDPTGRAAIESFCETTQHVIENREDWNLAERIEVFAEQRLAFVSTAAVQAAVGKMQAIFDLASFDFKTAHLYERACFH